MEDRSKRAERIESLEETATWLQVSNHHSQPSLNILRLSSLPFQFPRLLSRPLDTSARNWA